MKPRIAVLTTFSKAGFDQYASRMIKSWLKHWPADVNLVVYPDEPVPLGRTDNLRPVYADNAPKKRFIEEWSGDERCRGGTPYNYRFDAIKFCHKPFALYDFALRNQQYPTPYDGLIWLDADTITHADITDDAMKALAPMEHDVQFLGRQHKYSECGYMWFNLRGDVGMDLLTRWIDLYRTGAFIKQPEWHDSYLFDVARKTMTEGRFNDLTGHLPRRAGGGHPFVNSFLGRYMDHLKGGSRKVTGKPRKGDLFTNHEQPYWKANSHAKSRTKARR